MGFSCLEVQGSVIKGSSLAKRTAKFVLPLSWPIDKSPLGSHQLAHQPAHRLTGGQALKRWGMSAFKKCGGSFLLKKSFVALFNKSHSSCWVWISDRETNWRLLCRQLRKIWYIFLDRLLLLIFDPTNIQSCNPWEGKRGKEYQCKIIPRNYMQKKFTVWLQCLSLCHISYRRAEMPLWYIPSEIWSTLPFLLFLFALASSRQGLHSQLVPGKNGSQSAPLPGLQNFYVTAWPFIYHILSASILRSLCGSEQLWS